MFDADGVVGGTTGVVGGLLGGVVGGRLGVDGADGEGCDRLGCGCEDREEEDGAVGVCSVNGAGLELGPAAGAAAVLVGVAGASEDELAGAVTVTNPGAALPPLPGAIGARRFGAPSSTVEPVPAGPPCRIPGATKANAAMAAVDRLPMAIGVGRSGLNGLRARWRAL
ncbi:hypothetical protein [Catenulispora sp. GP43]|uniref:hypothetical protein n=1 Tax=Catenulispora sp. GP43 TaxID=3156263 RepID=UPI003516CAA0